MATCAKIKDGTLCNKLQDRNLGQKAAILPFTRRFSLHWPLALLDFQLQFCKMAGTSIYLRWVLENWSKSGVLHSIQWQK
jgi:hypothetical protein